MPAKKSAKSKPKPPPISLDSTGVPWISGVEVKVVEIVLDKLAHGGGVKEIKARFPKLTQRQVSAALEYFRQHQDQFEIEIERRWRQINQLGARDADSPFQRRLRELSRKKQYRER